MRRMIIVALLCALSYAQTENVTVSNGEVQCNGRGLVRSLDMAEYDATNGYSMMTSQQCSSYDGIDLENCKLVSTRGEAGPENVEVSRPWNMQCEDGFAMVGFFDDDDDDYLHDIDFVKCCQLSCIDSWECPGTLIESSQCTIHEKTSWEDTSVLQCPQNSILVGVYDNEQDNFNDLKAGKCCGITFANGLTKSVTQNTGKESDSRTMSYVMGFIAVFFILVLVVMVLFESTRGNGTTRTVTDAGGMVELGKTTKAEPVQDQAGAPVTVWTARNKVIVIGKGRFGSATAQGLRGSHIKTNSGDLIPVEVVHVSARKFTAMPGEMARQLTGVAFIAYCGTRLQNYANALSAGMKLARGDATSVNTSVHDDIPSLEFLDFSNPDPIDEKDDLTGAIQLHRALGGGKGEWKVWKITEVSSLDMANAENASSHAMVYGEGVARGALPKLQMPGLIWTPAVGSKSDLLGEVHHRMMERASIDRWYDGFLVGIACFIFTATYAITRYSQNFNGGEPDRSILMYLLDKAFAWTGLWMMVISPYAGNVLALRGLYGRFGSLSLMYKVITVMSTLLMFIPICTFTFTWFTWVVLRAIFFRNRSFKQLYQDQTRGVAAGATKFFKACLVDLVLLKGETGCIGFIYALVHSFVGIIVADVAYKGYWFGEDGRMLWRFEASMTTGVVSTCLLMCVALRSVLGHASWIKLKPLYSYLSPMGMWFATFHVIIFGYKGWVKLGDYGYHNGQPGITFVSSSFPTCVLLTHHFMQIFGAKRQLSNSDLWQHSFINLAIQDFNKTTKTLRLGTGGYTATTRDMQQIAEILSVSYVIPMDL